MPKLFTPSTGTYREMGPLGLNGRGFAAGQRVLFLSAMGGWQVGTISIVGEHGATMANRASGVVAFRDMVGELRPGTDEAALVSRVLAAAAAGDAAIEQARQERRLGLLDVFEAGELDRVGPMVPGM